MHVKADFSYISSTLTTPKSHCICSRFFHICCTKANWIITTTILNYDRHNYYTCKLLPKLFIDKVLPNRTSFLIRSQFSYNLIIFPLFHLYHYLTTTTNNINNHNKRPAIDLTPKSDLNTTNLSAWHFTANTYSRTWKRKRR